MKYTSAILKDMSAIGERVAVKNAFLSLCKTILFVNKKYGVKMVLDEIIKCEFKGKSAQSIKNMPFLF